MYGEERNFKNCIILYKFNFDFINIFYVRIHTKDFLISRLDHLHFCTLILILRLNADTSTNLERYEWSARS